MIKTLGNNIVSAFTGGNPVKAIYAYGQLVWPVTIESSYYIQWQPTSLSSDETMTVKQPFDKIKKYLQEPIIQMPLVEVRPLIM